MGLGASARGMQGNEGDTRGTYGSWCKVPGECRVMQGNARGMYRRVCNVPGECRGMQANARRMQGIVGKRMEVGLKCQGNAGECQGNEREWVQSANGMQGMQGNARGM